MKKLTTLLFLSISSFCVGGQSQQPTFTDRWMAVAKFVGEDQRRVEWDNQNDVDWLIDIQEDSMFWYIEGRKVIGSPYNVSDDVITIEGMTLTMLDDRTAHLKDEAGKTSVIFQRKEAQKYGKIPKDLFEIWEGYSKYLTNEEGDTVDYTSAKMGYTNDQTIAFSDDERMHTFIPGGHHLYDIQFKYRNDSLFFVYPYLVGSDTFYLEESYRRIRKLTPIAFIYEEEDLMGNYLVGFIKAFEREKYSWADTPDKLIGSWKGRYEFKMNNGDTVRTSPKFSLFGVESGTAPIDATNKDSYTFLPNNEVLIAWNNSHPGKHKYEVKDNTITIYKFPLAIQGKQKYGGIDAVYIQELTSEKLVVRTSQDMKYDLITFQKVKTESISNKFIVGLEKNGQQKGIWGEYHTNGHVKSLTYYWDWGLPKEQINFSESGKVSL